MNLHSNMSAASAPKRKGRSLGEVAGDVLLHVFANFLAYLVGFTGLIIIAGASLSALTPKERVTAPSAPSGFSSWDGSHRGFVAAVKAKLHDPASFEHVSTKVGEVDGRKTFAMTFRARNGFGALRIHVAATTATPSGEPDVTEITIISQ